MIRLGAVPVFVSNHDRALEFYSDRLGFEVVMDYQFSTEFRWVAVARRKGETELILYHPTPALAGNQVNELTKRIGIWTGLIFLTDDIQGTYQMLRERGVELEAQPRQQAWGGWEAWFSDPDGNRFYLAQRPDYM